MIIVFVLYFALTLCLGLWEARKTKSQSDFVLGGKKLPGWMLALSERATGESAWLLLGLTGFIYATGLSGIWTGVGCLLGISTAWIVLARKFRAEAEAYKAMTMPEYFAAKFASKANLIRVLSTGIIVFFFVFYVGAQFAGAGKTIQQTFGFSPFWGMIISAVVILGYATFGGFVSVVAVDTFQSILMLTTLVVTPVILLVKILASPVSPAQAFAAAGPGFGSLTGGLAGFAAGLMIFNNLAWFFGYLGGQPQLNARVHGHEGRKKRPLRPEHRRPLDDHRLQRRGHHRPRGPCPLRPQGGGRFRDDSSLHPEQPVPGLAGGPAPGRGGRGHDLTAESMLLVAATSISEDVYKGILKKAGPASAHPALDFTPFDRRRRRLGAGPGLDDERSHLFHRQLRLGGNRTARSPGRASVVLLGPLQRGRRRDRSRLGSRLHRRLDAGRAGKRSPPGPRRSSSP